MRRARETWAASTARPVRCREVRILAILLAALAAAAAADPAEAPARGSKPNVVVIMTDDQTFATARRCRRRAR